MRKVEGCSRRKPPKEGSCGVRACVGKSSASTYNRTGDEAELYRQAGGGERFERSRRRWTAASSLDSPLALPRRGVCVVGSYDTLRFLILPPPHGFHMNEVWIHATPALAAVVSQESRGAAHARH